MNSNHKDMEVKKAVYEKMKKSTIVTFFLWFFFGSFGVHRYYLGRPLSGTFLLFTSVICYGLFYLSIFQIKNPSYGPLIILIPVIWLLVDLFLLRSMTAKYNFQLHEEIMELVDEIE